MIGPYPEPGVKISGGVERVIDTLLPELAGRIDLTLIVPGASQDMESTTCGVRTIYLRRGFGPGALRYWTSDARRVAAAVGRLRPDIIHLQGVAGVGRLIALPSVLTIHGIVHRDLVTGARGSGWGQFVRAGVAQVVRTVESRARRRLGSAIIINPYVFEVLPDLGRLRTFAIPNPVDPVFLSPVTDEGTRERRIVSVGRLGPLKDTLGIIRIASAVMKQDARVSLAVYGQPVDESYRDRCQELIRAEGLEGRIEMRGNVSKEQLREAFDRSSCLIMASKQENAPMAIAEAHSRGVSVVAPEAFGIKYMIAPGRNGVFLPMGNIAAQADALGAALDHNWDRVAIAKEASNAYSPGHVAGRILAAYRDVMDTHRAGRSPRA
jgi:glycosyltransferase involved in cell wall biosynthesis